MATCGSQPIYHPAAFSSRRQRIRLHLAARIIHLKPDSFVYCCRDSGFNSYQTTQLLQFYYRMDHGTAKRMSLLSPAWGQAGVNHVKFLDALFDEAEQEIARENQAGQ